MITRLLSPSEFRATFAEPMRSVSAGDADLIDIHPYIAAVPSAELLGNTVADRYVEHIYRNGTETFDHVLIATSTRNVFLAIVVDLMRKAVHGHHLLDLNREYGLGPDL